MGVDQSEYIGWRVDLVNGEHRDRVESASVCWRLHVECSECMYKAKSKCELAEGGEQICRLACRCEGRSTG